MSPIELVALIANKTSSFKFDATIDRFDGASYKPGETFSMRVTSEKPGYLYLLQVDSSGTPSLLYPTAGEDNRIRGGKLVEVKPGGIAGGFPVVGPAGILRIKSIVTSRPVAFSGSLDALQQGQGKRKVRPVQFRWHPTQQRQIKALLSQKQQTSAKQLGCKQPQDVLGPFAQDMTMLYIDPR
ncbi:MAG: DUF4384 domain-containing protein [Planctomycetes bacterium]|nr:DUF4384 domain-containing protein [Planctomycetota bacterium]